jgi:hypothetical protein
VQPVEQLLSRAALHGQPRTDRTRTRPRPTAHGVAVRESEEFTTTPTCRHAWL